MKIRRTLAAPVLVALIAGLTLTSESAMARGFTGGRAVVGHSTFGGGFSRGFSGVPAYRGYAGFRGYSGARYYGGGWGGGGWGLGVGLGLGLFVASLPLYYSTVWWDHTPYYYADNTYYRYNTGVGKYETVAPPSGVQAAAASDSGELFAYPKNGQSDEQLSKDKYDCYSWARSQSGFDPAQSGAAQVGTAQSGTSPGSGNRAEYLRAESACLEGRGYSVR